MNVHFLFPSSYCLHKFKSNEEKKKTSEEIHEQDDELAEKEVQY